MEDIEKEVGELKSAVENARMRAEWMQQMNKENRRLWITLAFAGLLIICLVFGMAYQDAVMDQKISQALSESQETFNQAMIEALNTVAEVGVTSDTTTTTTTTQTIEGESAVINNVEGEQYNDSAQKVGGE